MFSQLDAQVVRGDFPILARCTYLNSCAKGALSKQVEGAFHDYLQSWHEHGADWDLWLERVEMARHQFARLVRAAPAEVAVTTSVSVGVSTLLSCLDYRERDTIVLARDDFPSLGHICAAQVGRGARVVALPGEPSLADYDRVVDSRAAIVVTHHLHHETGNAQDVPALARLCRGRGALLCVDAYHSVGAVDLDVGQVGADFLVTGAMKYLLGSAGGVAFLYARGEVLPALAPVFTGWFAQRDPFAFDPAALDYDPSARRLETGLPPIASIYAAYAGLKLLNGLGISEIDPYVSQLAEEFARGLTRLGLEPLTRVPNADPQRRCPPMVALRAADGPGAVARLRALGVLVANWKNSLRFSFHCYNTGADVEAALAAVAACRELFL